MAETANQSYTITFADPKTGKARRGTVTSTRDLSDTALSQLAKQQAEEAGVPVESIKIVKTGDTAGPTPGEWTGKREGVGPFKMATKVGKVAAEALPYAALGLVAPEASTLKAVPKIGEFLAAHPEITGAALRSLGAGGIGAVEGAVESKDATRSGMGSAGVQAALEGLLGGGYRVAKRLGGSALRKMEDTVVGRLMEKVTQAVPWLKSIPASHDGLRDMIQRGEGASLLSKNYGAALQGITDLVPETDRMMLTVQDAHALKIPSEAMDAVVPSAYAGKNLSVEEAHRLLSITHVNVPTRTVIDKVHGVWKRDPELSIRTMSALDDTLGAIAETLPKEFREIRNQFKIGTNLIQGLKAMDVFDPASKRLNVEKLSIGSDALFGEVGTTGESVWEKYLKSPESKQIIKDVIPKGKAPHAVGVPRFFLTPYHIGIGEHGGGETVKSALSKLQPNTIFYSANVPLTTGEKATMHRLPGYSHAAAKAVDAMGASPGNDQSK